MSLDAGLIGHWPLQEDARNRLAPDAPVTVKEVNFTKIGDPAGPWRAAQFNGRTSHIGTALPGGISPADQPCSLSLWLHTKAGDGDVVGDLVNCFDPDARQGFTLSVVSNNGVTSSPLANDRHLHFGIDNGRADERWFDHGRPGDAAMVSALHVHEGQLFAGTLELGVEQTGHLWRYEGEGQWLDLGGCPDGSNCVPAITHFNGALYCSTGRYNPQGSALGPPQNTRPGGRVYRIDEDGAWIDLGLAGARGATPESDDVPGYFTDKADETTGLMPWRGELLAISNHRKGVWRYAGDKDWEWIGPDARLFTLTNFRDDLYAMVNGGPVLCYAGDGEWEDCGKPETSRQTYSAAIFENELYVGTWPEAEVYRYGGEQRWEKLPRLGWEREVMGMAVYNGKLYAGSLPMAHVFRMDGQRFTFVGNLDDAEVALRRVWNLAVYRGRLFGGTLPQGRVRSIQAGAMATSDRALTPGWHHIAAVRHRDRLRLYLDGEWITDSAGFDPRAFNARCAQPIRIGGGQHAALNGALADLRLYEVALDPGQVRQLATVEAAGAAT